MTTTVVDVHDAKTHLSRLLDRAAAGEEIVIGRAGTPVARLVALEPAPPIVFGRLEGKIDVSHVDEADRDIDEMFHGDDAAAGHGAIDQPGDRRQ